MNENNDLDEEKRIREYIQTIFDFTIVTKTKISDFLQLLNSSKTLQPLPNLPFFSVLPLLVYFSDNITKLQNPTLESLAKCVMQNPYKTKLKPLVKQIQNEIPKTKAERKKHLSKASRTELKSIIQSSKEPEAYWLTLPVSFYQKWYSFWDFACGLKSDSIRSKEIYHTCKTEFELVDPQDRLQAIREQYKEQISLLKNHIEKWEYKNIESMPLYGVLEGKVISNSFADPILVDALLYFFDEKLYLYRIKTGKVESQLNINIWILNSMLFPKDAVVDILGTDFSFAFLPQDSKSRETLWRIWNLLKSDTTIDFGMFQPIKLDENAPDILDWIEIND